MSEKYPIIAVTGSAGSGITTARDVFAKIFEQNTINAAFVHGNAFRRYPREQLERIFRDAEKRGSPISAFGPEVNLLNRLEGLFREFSRCGTGVIREYIESDEQADAYHLPKGEFSAWRDIPDGTDMLFYEGHHGGCVESSWSRRKLSESHNPVVVQVRQKSRSVEDAGVDIAQWVDLLIGIVPSINLEWMQKINRSCKLTSCTTEDAVNIILRRMPDYVNYITPQFSLTDINFQKIPLVDTSNPFIQAEVPIESECMVVVRFREPKKYDLIGYKNQFPGSFFSRPNTLVVPNSYFAQTIRTICTPIVEVLTAGRAQATGVRC